MIKSKNIENKSNVFFLKPFINIFFCLNAQTSAKKFPIFKQTEISTNYNLNIPPPLKHSHILCMTFPLAPQHL